MSGYYKLGQQVRTITSSPENSYKVKRIFYKRYNLSKGKWMPDDNAGKRSTLFPDSWSWEKIRKEVRIAYHNAGTINSSSWKGRCSEGFEIGGFINKINGNDIINSAFPIY